MAILGETNILYVHDGTAYRPVACLTSNGLDTALGVVESPETKCDPGVITKTAGSFSYTVPFEGLYIDTGVGGDTTKASHDFLLALQMAGTNVTWKLDTGLTTNTAYYGTAIIEGLSLGAPIPGESTFSGNLNGSGAIVLVDPIP